MSRRTNYIVRFAFIKGMTCAGNLIHYSESVLTMHILSYFGGN
jgi:hypothetical protein